MWRAQREAAARFTEAWRELLESTAGRTAKPGALPGVEEQLQALTRSAADYAGVTLQPLRDLADNQRDFADQMTHWAQLQRDLADNMALWAARQREYTDALDRLLARLRATPLGFSSSSTTTLDSRAITEQANRVLPGAGA